MNRTSAIMPALVLVLALLQASCASRFVASRVTAPEGLELNLLVDRETLLYIISARNNGSTSIELLDTVSAGKLWPHQYHSFCGIQLKDDSCTPITSDGKWWTSPVPDPINEDLAFTHTHPDPPERMSLGPGTKFTGYGDLRVIAIGLDSVKPDFQNVKYFRLQVRVSQFHQDAENVIRIETPWFARKSD